jgi:predicted amidohydrolase YtcJ
LALSNLEEVMMQDQQRLISQWLNPVFKTVSLITLAVLPAIAYGAQSCPSGEDWVLTNGVILTMNEANTTADTIRIRGKHIVSLSESFDRNEECIQIVDLEGRTVIPGLIDSHTHFVRTAQAPGPFITGLEAARSIAELQAALRAAAAKAMPGEWIASIGGITPLQFAEQRFPTRQELSDAVNDNPVWLQGGYLRQGMVNSAGIRALQAARIPVTEEGIVSNDGVGLTHVLRTRTDERMKSRFRDYMAYAMSLGLTSIVDQGCCDFLGAQMTMEDRPNLRIAEELWRAGQLPLRMRIQFDHRDILEQTDLNSVSARVLNATFGLGDDYYKGIGVGERVIADEASDDEVFEAYLNVAEAGWPLSQHTIREDEIERYLSIMERVAAIIPIDSLRWSLEHIFEITPNQIERLKVIGASVRVQDHDYLRNGSVSWNAGPPFRTLLESGIRMGAGTDSGVVGPLNPWQSLYYMVTGKHAGGVVIIPGEQIDRMSALKLYTASNAWFLGEEDSLGSLEAGKLADLVILDQPFLEIDEEEIRNVRPLLTMIGGKVTHARGTYNYLVE